MTTSAKNLTIQSFWHLPVWKWGVFLIVIACAAILLLRKPPKVEVKLLKVQDPHPTWDGSFPYLVISPNKRTGEKPDFKVSVQQIKPTLGYDSPIDEFQVDLHSGMFVLRKTDLFLPDVIPISVMRTYRPWYCCATAFGMGTNHSYDICPTGTRFPYTFMDLNLEDGRQIHFRRISEGTGYADAVFRHDDTTSEFHGAQIAWDGDGWTMSLRDGNRVKFPESYYARNCAQGAPISTSDATGHELRFERDGKRNLERVISPSGRNISFTYDGANRVRIPTDDSGNLRKYAYDPSGHLQTVSDGSHVLYRFEYARLLNWKYDPYLMISIIDEDWNLLLRNVYKDRSRVSEQKLSDGEVFRYEYVFDTDRNEITETVVTFPDKSKHHFFFEHGIPKTSESAAPGSRPPLGRQPGSQHCC